MSVPADRHVICSDGVGPAGPTLAVFIWPPVLGTLVDILSSLKNTLDYYKKIIIIKIVIFLQ